MIQLPTIIYIYINLSQLPVLQDLHWPSCWVPALPNLEVADQTGFVKGLGTAPPTDATARWWTQLRWIDSRMSQKIEGKKWKVKPPDMYTYIYIQYIYIQNIYIQNIYIHIYIAWYRLMSYSIWKVRPQRRTLWDESPTTVLHNASPTSHGQISDSFQAREPSTKPILGYFLQPISANIGDCMRLFTIEFTILIKSLKSFTLFWDSLSNWRGNHLSGSALLQPSHTKNTWDLNHPQVPPESTSATSLWSKKPGWCPWNAMGMP